MSRYRARLLFFLLLVAGTAAAILVARVSPAMEETSSVIPPEAQEAMQSGRYHKAARIMREYLAESGDTTPAALLLAAQAEAAIENWPRVDTLLNGRAWLDSYANGAGWSLLGRTLLALGQWQASDEAFSRYLRANTAGGERQTGIAELRRAQALTEQKKIGDALGAYDRAAQLLPQIADWIALQAAGAAAAGGDTAAVERRFAGLDADMREWAWQTRVRAYGQAGDSARAQAVAAEVARVAQAARRRAEALNVVGTLQLALGDTAGARDALRRAMLALPNTDVAYTAATRLIRLPALTAEDRLRIGRVYLRLGDEQQGLREIQRYLASGAPSQDAATQIRFEIAQHHFNRRNYDVAERDIAAILPNMRPATAAEAMYLMARAQYRASRVEQSRETFRRVANSYPGHAAATRSLFMLADLDHDDRVMARATEYYRRAVQSGSTTPEAALSYMRLGVNALTENKAAEARSIFEEYYRRFTSGTRRQQAAFWLARSHQRLGSDSTARRLFRETRNISPLTYYGVRAADELNQPVLSGVATTAPETTERERTAVNAALARIDLLRDIGWTDAATYEVSRARRAFDRQNGALYAYAEALNQRDYAAAAGEIGRTLRTREDGLNRRLLQILYPLPFADIIVAEAREKGVDPFFAAALIRQESSFRPAVISPAGAIGLMQVMPATGRTVAGLLRIDGFSPDDLKEPEVNVMIGMRYLADRLRSYDMRPEMALAAYNAGSTRVDRWRDFPEAADPELFAERIPFEETRDYVRIVQLNARIYNALYDSTGVPANSRP